MLLRNKTGPAQVGRQAAHATIQRPVLVPRGLAVRALATAAPPAPIDDKTVPEGHKGLHNYLYSGDADKEHEQDAYKVRKVSKMVAGVSLQARGNTHDLAWAGVGTVAEAAVRRLRAAVGRGNGVGH